MGGATFSLPPRLDTAAAEALAHSLLELADQDLVLDGAAVELFGALSLQAIRSAAQSWAQAGHRLTMENLSDDGRAQLALLGFSPETVTGWEALT